jgi:hypothetical protein
MIANQTGNVCILWAEGSNDRDYRILVAIATTLNTSIFYDVDKDKHGIRISQLDKFKQPYGGESK